MILPALRFSEFSGDWEKKKLGDLCATFKSGSGITSEYINNHGNYPVYGGNGLRGYTDSFTHDGFYLLIGRQGALCGNINRSFGKAYISEHAIAVRANETSNTEWLSQKLNLLNLNRLSESSAQPGLAVNKLIKLEFEVPSLPEQTKIANFLTAVDEKISLLTQKATLLSQYKKGVMQRIFSQELRFKDDDGQEFPEWKEKTLGDVVQIIRGKNIIASTNGKNFLLGMGSVSENGTLIINKKTDDNINFLHENDLIMPERDIGVGLIIGKVAIIKENYKFILGSNLLRLIVKEGILSKFSYYLINSSFFNKQIKEIVNGSAQLMITATEVKKLTFIFPSLPEQNKVANFLTAIDEKITNNKNQLDAVKQYKQGLLQQMFV